MKINFIDFWPNFKKNDNYFFHLLSTKYHVEIDEEDPDLLFFSVNYNRSKDLDKYKYSGCKKIFFTGENVRPNFDVERIEYPNYSIGKCDFALSFDYTNDQRSYRFPLWAFFINWFNIEYCEERDPAYLVPMEDLIKRKIGVKQLFCNFLYQNTSGERLSILNTINQYKDVVCGGSLRNNFGPIGGRGDQKNKIDFISNFKFTIAAENSKYNGYTTEKMIHPMSVGSIPIYWGSDRVIDEFNERAFINANDLSETNLINKIIEIDKNDDLYQEMINEPIFINGCIPEDIKPTSILKFIEDNIC